MRPKRPKEYVISSRDESLDTFVEIEGDRLAPGVPKTTWLELNRNKKLHVGDRVFVPMTQDGQTQLHAYLSSVIEEANRIFSHVDSEA